MCSPLMKTDGTVRWPVLSSNAPCMSAPLSSVSSSTIFASTLSFANSVFVDVQNGQYVLLNTTTSLEPISASTNAAESVLLIERDVVEVAEPTVPDTFLTKVDGLLLPPATTKAPAPMMDAEAMAMVTAVGIFILVVVVVDDCVLSRLTT
mmetsp:Transcript_3020/g.4755  ORF Transcript_3020/g.4755 Transcript_3020/m.4755 type:complete len:150 (-) Transcript_3020:18-467(-)